MYIYIYMSDDCKYNMRVRAGPTQYEFYDLLFLISFISFHFVFRFFFLATDNIAVRV